MTTECDVITYFYIRCNSTPHFRIYNSKSSLDTLHFTNINYSAIEMNSRIKNEPLMSWEMFIVSADVREHIAPYLTLFNVTNGTSFLLWEWKRAAVKSTFALYEFTLQVFSMHVVHTKYIFSNIVTINIILNTRLRQNFNGLINITFTFALNAPNLLKIN